MNSNSTATVKARPAKSAPAPKKPAPLKVSDDTLARLTKIFRLLADESRIKIVLALAQDGEVHVSALCKMLGTPAQPMSQPAVSHHLTLMRLTGLVNYRRQGKNNYYRLEGDYIRELLEQVFADCGNSQQQIQFDDFALAYKRGR
ncbi:MAG TPA: metalloregulator ArsR/SmtB family transcription factor [Gemmataceae bacterium]|nr:metalloregulator ArsR/SmtB family transcription factor [Gemmataceae bacterium]